MNCADWLCIVNKAISATSPDAQETLVLVILALFAAALLLGLVITLYLLAKAPIGAIVKRRRAANGREPEMSPIERLLLQQQRNNESMLTTIHDLIQQNVLQTNAVVALGNELKKANDIEERRAVMHETDLKSISDNSLALAETIANQGAQIARQIDTTAAGITSQITGVKGAVSSAHTKLDVNMQGLELLNQRVEKARGDDIAAIENLQRVIVDRLDQLPSEIANQVKPLLAEWLKNIDDIKREMTSAELRVVTAFNKLLDREQLLRDLAESVKPALKEPPQPPPVVGLS